VLGHVIMVLFGADLKSARWIHEVDDVIRPFG
jgi:hypothetical protein